MIRTTKCRTSIVAGLLTMVLIAPAQTQRPREELSIQGYSGQATVVRSQGHVFVDVQDLARMTNGSLSFEGNRIILTLPVDRTSERPVDSGSGFSRGFMRAAIQAMAAMREWGGTLLVCIENGYPVGNTMSGNAIMAEQDRAAESIALASAAASTDSDYRGLELLKNEFNNAQAWSDGYAKARNSLSAANYTSGTALNDDGEAQKVLHCGQFLAQMFASGTFEDDVACH